MATREEAEAQQRALDLVQASRNYKLGKRVLEVRTARAQLKAPQTAWLTETLCDWEWDAVGSPMSEGGD